MKSNEIDIPEVNVGGFLASNKSTEHIKPNESTDHLELQLGKYSTIDWIERF